MSIVLDALDRVQKNEHTKKISVTDTDIQKEKKAFLRIDFKRWLIYFLFDSMLCLGAFFLIDHFLDQKKIVIKTEEIQQPTETPPPAPEAITPPPEPSIPPLAAEPAPIKPESDIIKHEENPSLELYKQAVHLLSNHESAKALQLLSSEQENPNLYLPVIKKIAVLLFETHQITLATEILNQALSQYPKDITIREYLGLAYFSEENYKKTIDLLLTKQPSLQKHTSYYALLAASYLKTDRLQEATQLYLALINIEPSNPNFFLGLAISYHAQEKPVVAENYYRTALYLSPINWSSRGFVVDQLATIGAKTA